MLSVYLFILTNNLAYIPAAIMLILAYPIIVVFIATPVIYGLKVAVIQPGHRRRIGQARNVFHHHPGIVIAVAGSYGKTSMKELLAAVLAAENEIAYTEGNKNVMISQAAFSERLTGKEDIVIVEFGEGYKGDIAKMTDMVDPDYAILTGLAPNHLDQYESLDNLIKDFSSLVKHIDRDKVYINADSRLHDSFAENGLHYSENGVDNLEVLSPKILIDGTEFRIRGDDVKGDITVGLIGRHNIGAVACVIHLALRLGVSFQSIQKVLKGVKPYEHRMEPRPLHGSWLIDDTYNGNLEGVRAGCELLRELSTDGRKIYVTPGLVDQGTETDRIHLEIGGLIASAKPDIVYLMKNSVTAYIEDGLLAAGYDGELRIVDEPLEFYSSLESIIAKGDIVMMQNDWPDNYA